MNKWNQPLLAQTKRQIEDIGYVIDPDFSRADMNNVADLERDLNALGSSVALGVVCVMHGDYPLYLLYDKKQHTYEAASEILAYWATQHPPNAD